MKRLALESDVRVLRQIKKKTRRVTAVVRVRSWSPEIRSPDTRVSNGLEHLRGFRRADIDHIIQVIKEEL